MSNPFLPQQPPIFDNIHQTLTTAVLQDILTGGANLILSLSNTNSALFLAFPPLLPLAFFLRNTVQQVISTQDQLQGILNRTESEPITIIDHTRFIVRRLLGYSEPLSSSGASGYTSSVSANGYRVRQQEILQRQRDLHLAQGGEYNSLPAQDKVEMLPVCPLCRHNPTMPCDLTSCGHVYCWYCVTQLFNAKQVCVECYTPIVGFRTFGTRMTYEMGRDPTRKHIHYEDTNDYLIRIGKLTPKMVREQQRLKAREARRKNGEEDYDDEDEDYEDDYDEDYEDEGGNDGNGNDDGGGGNQDFDEELDDFTLTPSLFSYGETDTGRRYIQGPAPQAQRIIPLSKRKPIGKKK
jgi:hypothetical protein